MIKGIGLDLVELSRIQHSIKKSDRLMKRILTESEQSVYQNLNSEHRRIEYLAGRFAAKEAFAKAAGQGIGKLSFKDIQVLSNEKGAPTIRAQGYDHINVFISITHTSHYAAAQVVIEENESNK